MTLKNERTGGVIAEVLTGAWILVFTYTGNVWTPHPMTRAWVEERSCLVMVKLIEIRTKDVEGAPQLGCKYYEFDKPYRVDGSISA